MFRNLLLLGGLAGVGYFIYNYLMPYSSSGPVFDTQGPLLMNASSTSLAGISFIKSNEGFSPKAYWDYKAYSIGYGHQIVTGDGLSKTSVLTEPQAASLLSSDIRAVVDPAISRYVQVPLTQSQWDALADFIYNVGVGAFSQSTLLADLNKGDYQSAAAQFQRWKYAGGNVNAGLVARRQAETQLFTA